MPILTSSIIKTYLRSGRYDDDFRVLPGRDTGEKLENARAAKRELKDALLAEIRSLEATGNPTFLKHQDLAAHTRAKIEPMVRGLFPADEQDTVLGILEHSVVILTPNTIAEAIENERHLSTAWTIANLYLEGIGANLLGKSAPRIVGLSQGMTCYLSMAYFEPCDRFADFLVHEAAHVFHNCKREVAGLPVVWRQEWLLPIEFRHRETFAYACEAYSRILGLGKTRAERLALVNDHLTSSPPPDERVDLGWYGATLREAVLARNGWKRILGRCASQHRKRRSVLVPT